MISRLYGVLLSFFPVGSLMYLHKNNNAYILKLMKEHHPVYYEGWQMMLFLWTVRRVKGFSGSGGLALSDGRRRAICSDGVVVTPSVNN